MSFVVTNNGTGQVRVDISPIYFSVDSKFMPAAKPLNASTTKNDDLSSFIIVSPKVVSIKQGEQRTVRVSVRPQPGLKEGEYRAHILFSMLDIADSVQVKGKKGKKGEEGLSMKINFKSETAVVIYGSVGKGLADLKTSCSLLKNGKTKVVITNSGKWRFDGWLRIYDGSKKLADEKVFMTRESIRDTVLNWAPKDSKGPITIKWVPLDNKKKEFTTTCSVKAGA
jgi:P pilus assembly chaperone PapD